MGRITTHDENGFELRLATEKNVEELAKPGDGEHGWGRWWAVVSGWRIHGSGGWLVSVSIIVVGVVFGGTGDRGRGMRGSGAGGGGGDGEEVGQTISYVFLEEFEVFELEVGVGNLVAADADAVQE